MKNKKVKLALQILLPLGLALGAVWSKSVSLNHMVNTSVYLVVKESVYPGDVINKEDISVIEIMTSYAPRYAVKAMDVSVVVGARATRSLLPGQFLLSTDLETERNRIQPEPGQRVLKLKVDEISIKTNDLYPGQMVVVWVKKGESDFETAPQKILSIGSQVTVFENEGATNQRVIQLAVNKNDPHYQDLVECRDGSGGTEILNIYTRRSSDR